MVKILCDTKEFDELLLDVINQACGIEDKSYNGKSRFSEPQIDNQCLSAYEDACDYLVEKGYLTTLNGRIYTFKKRLLKKVKQ
jgi:hypothetical protein